MKKLLLSALTLAAVLGYQSTECITPSTKTCDIAVPFYFKESNYGLGTFNPNNGDPICQTPKAWRGCAGAAYISLNGLKTIACPEDVLEDRNHTHVSAGLAAAADI